MAKKTTVQVSWVGLLFLAGGSGCSEPQNLEFLDELVDGGADASADASADAAQQPCADGGELGEPCSEGVGACERAGIYVCTAGRVTCSGKPGSPSEELCDSERDEDCDGTVDEAPDDGCCVDGECGELERCERRAADDFAPGMCVPAGDENAECVREGDEIVCSCRQGYEGDGQSCERNGCIPLEGEDPPCGGNESCEPAESGEVTCACLEAFGDCDDDVGNGCETDLETTANHCGGCGYECSEGLGCAGAACEARFAQLALGFSSTVGITAQGDVLGAGNSLLGQTANATTFVELAVDGAASVSVNVNHACLLRPDGNGATCWGSNAQLELGSADTADRQADLAVVGARAISTGGYHSCLVDSAGYVYCWGDGHSGELGNGQPVASDFPGRTFTEAISNNFRVHYVENAVDVHSGNDINCALTSAGFVYCWGIEGAIYAPEFVRDADAAALDDAASICAGTGHGCALRQGGTVVCWGDNSYGQLGSDDVPAGRNRYVTVPLQNVVSLACGSGHTCAVVEEGRAYCWGFNSQGQLGSGDSANSGAPVPVLMTDLEPARSIHSGPGAVATCMQLRSGAVYCWGFNYYRQLGLGTAPGGVEPAEVTDWP